jgi:hypothetical protein
MGLEFKPETIEQLKNRFHIALENVFDVNALTNQNRPGLKRDHVFDFDDGIRLIISVDLCHGLSYLHVSGSTQVADKKMTRLQLLESMILKINLLNAKPVYGKGNTMVSKSGVIHLVIPLTPEHMKIGEPG